MPCTYDETPDLRAELEHVTKLLCKLCESCEATLSGDLIDAVPGLRRWWERHKKLDAERAARR